MRARRQARWLVLESRAHLRPDDRKMLQHFVIGHTVHRRHWKVQP